MQTRTLLLRALALSALALSSTSGAQASLDSPPPTFEPALRDLWVRGSERFHRQWLIAGPVNADVAADIDPTQLKPAAWQELTARHPHIRWAAQTAWSDVTDASVSPPRTPETDDRPVDRFVFVAGSLPSAAGGPAELSIGSERPYSVWLNGRLVHTRQSAETFSPDQDRLAVELQRGDNQVLLRFHETSAGPSQFSLRAVPPGSVLQRMEEIAPSLLPASDQSLVVRTHFVTEKDAAPVALEVTAAGGEVVARQSSARGEVIKLDPKNWRDGAYEIRVSTQNSWKQPQARYLTWYKGDPIAAVRRLNAAADAAKGGVNGDSLRMLAALAKDRLGGSIEQASHSSWRLIHSPLMEFEELQLESQGRATARIHSNGFVRIAYTDEADGSTQFCRAYLPAEYSSAKRWPLIVSLHGFNPGNPEYIDWWSVDQRHHPIAATKGTIVIEAHGRGNAQYLGIGDRDVMRCLDEANQRFSIDADRVYLTGESMGGHGTWAIATRHPDVFAAAAPVYGGWDFRITNVSSLAEAPAPKTSLDAFALERASSFSNAENLLHVPLLVIHGDADTAVHVENSRHAVHLLQRWGYNVRYHEMPGWAHEDLGQRATIADWLLTHRRVTSPATIRLRSTELEGASAYWLRVRALQTPAEVIRVSAAVLQPGLVRIDSTNVAALALDLPTSLRGPADKLKVVWNGQTHELNTRGGAVELGSRPTASNLHKRAGLEGPLSAVIATPFAVVVGTTSSDSRMKEMTQAAADSLAKQWMHWQHQPLRMLKDTEVTAEHEKAYSLILIGGADANSVTRRLAKQLPFQASHTGIVVDGRTWKVKDSVLQAIYPSPLAADRYVYVVAATSADGMYFWRPQMVHFILGYPLTTFDWIIQDGRQPPPGTRDPAVAHVAAGVFDASWRRKDAWTQMRDYKSASSWTLRRAPAKEFVVSSNALQAVEGRYEIVPGLTVTFRTEGGSLVGEIPGRPLFPLLAESESTFIVALTRDTVEFIRDDTGKVTGAAIEDSGSRLWVKRLP